MNIINSRWIKPPQTISTSNKKPNYLSQTANLLVVLLLSTTNLIHFLSFEIKKFLVFLYYEFILAAITNGAINYMQILDPIKPSPNINGVDLTFSLYACT
jgi:hypothetical protein